MIKTRLHGMSYSRSRIDNCWNFEKYLPKEKVIEKLKNYIDELEAECLEYSTEIINEITMTLELKESLDKAQKELYCLKAENRDLKFYVKNLEESYDNAKKKLTFLQDSGIDYQYMKKVEEERDYYQLRYEREKLEKSNLQKRTFDIFQNCDTLEKLKKRKKALLGIYHPDDPCGDNEIARIILEQYNRKKAYLK